MKKTNKSKQEKGITLIALVLTIIVLMILAAVSVATLTGDNGILTKAQEARETTKKAEIEEQLRLAQLSAKIKKSGGDITISDILQELESQGVDFEKEDDGNTIIIDGKYVYELNETENGDISFEYQGTVSKPKPKVESIEIINKTETSIQVKVTVNWRNEGGTLKYYIKEEGAVDYTFKEEQEEEKYTFELAQNKTYSKIKVEAIAPNGETAYLEIDIKTGPTINMDLTEITATTNSITIKANATDLENGIAKYYFSNNDGVNWYPKDGQVKNSYTFNNLTQNETYRLKIKVTDTVGNETISDSIPTKTESVPNLVNKEDDTVKGNMIFTYTPNIATNTNVIVTIATDVQGYSIQYTTKDPTVESNWELYTAGATEIVFENNGLIYARLWDGTNAGGYATGNVINIDTLPPNAFTPTAASTHNSITVTASATDQAADSENACSGIDKYKFKLGDGDWTDYQSSGEYTFDSNLSADTNYTITVEAKDAAENTTTGTVTIKTKATYTVTYDANGGEGAPTPDTKIEDMNLTLNTTTVPKKEGHKFKGWGTTPTSTEVTTIFSENKNITFYAIYEEITIFFSKTAFEIDGGSDSTKYTDKLSAIVPSGSVIYISTGSITHSTTDIKATLNGELLTANVWDNIYPNAPPRGWYFEIVDGGLFEFEGSIKEEAQGHVGVEKFSVDSVKSSTTEYSYKFGKIAFTKTTLNIDGNDSTKYTDKLSAIVPSGSVIYIAGEDMFYGFIDVKATLNGELLTDNDWGDYSPDSPPRGKYFEIVDGGLFELESSISKGSQGHVGAHEISVDSVKSKEYNFLYEFE